MITLVKVMCPSFSFPILDIHEENVVVSRVLVTLMNILFFMVKLYPPCLSPWCLTCRQALLIITMEPYTPLGDASGKSLPSRGLTKERSMRAKSARHESCWSYGSQTSHFKVSPGMFEPVSFVSCLFLPYFEKTDLGQAWWACKYHHTTIHSVLLLFRGRCIEVVTLPEHGHWWPCLSALVIRIGYIV